MGIYLERLKIKPYKDADLTKQEGFVYPESFEAMFNPQTYKHHFENVYYTDQGMNTSAVELQYSYSEPQLIDMKLILDGTGVSDLGVIRVAKLAADLFRKDKKTSVSAQVKKFLKLCVDYRGPEHQPRFLLLVWGDFYFKCRLQSVDITYTMFDSNGKPLRAELDCKFQGDITEKDRVGEENRSSPDLTHYRTVRAGDTLPLLSEDIYGSPEYYIHVARANKLVNLRNLQPGQELIFPPIAQLNES